WGAVGGIIYIGEKSELPKTDIAAKKKNLDEEAAC
ncbi:unnamed protein product, partial [marine sediment metagenome]